MGKKILVVSPAWLGDIIMSQSLLSVLKQQDPTNSIYVYAPSYAHPILNRMPEVDEILTNPFNHGQFLLKERINEGKKLKGYNFDCAYILPNSLKSALPPYFAGIKQRIGLKGESRYLIINKMRSNKKAFPRMVDRYVSLAYIDDPKVNNAQALPKFDYPKLVLHKPSQELLDRLNISLDRPLLALGCGANYGPAKLWPVEYFARISANFIQNGGAVLGLGTINDSQTVLAILKHLNDHHLPYFYNIAGKTSLTEALDLVGVCKAAVCNDSGLMHTVAAAKVPQACIFGSTSTGYTPPLSDLAICLESDEPCHPCFNRTCKYGTYRCLKQITPEHVIDALELLFSKNTTLLTQSKDNSLEQENL